MPFASFILSPRYFKAEWTCAFVDAAATTGHKVYSFSAFIVMQKAALFIPGVSVLRIAAVRTPFAIYMPEQ